MDNRIDPQLYVTPGTRSHTIIGYLGLLILGPILILFTVLITYGIALLIWLVVGAFYPYRIAKARARLKGSAIRVTNQQFPEIFEITQAMSARLGLAQCPEIYIVENNQQNAFALKHGSRPYLILIDDLVYGTMLTGNAKALHFIIAHELAHHALGHTGLLRSLITAKYFPLSRLDEFTCDSVAHAVVGDLEAARSALTLLLVCPQLFSRVNLQALEDQAREVAADQYSRRSESTLSHPLLLRRYARLQPTGSFSPAPPIAAAAA